MFNKETEYALRALVYIQIQNSNGRRPGILEIAKEADAPQFFMAKILQRLAKLEVIQSLKGKGGGFYFSNGKENLTIKELVTLTGDTKSFDGCGFGLKSCDCNNPCPMHEQYAPIRDALNKLISTETILTLTKKYAIKSL
ncbi:MAG TPA: Rrf2 family transcriptional regulator [Prolixibacteraceae bacterium]|nr:Rrf2 family transcriptional regulator [Prolixibacteraceae bacterium]HPR86080.1 Rrf2 family transcriptional regulator [Prolixibacteraceae bacterium]